MYVDVIRPCDEGDLATISKNTFPRTADKSLSAQSLVRTDRPGGSVWPMGKTEGHTKCMHPY